MTRQDHPTIAILGADTLVAPTPLALLLLEGAMAPVLGPAEGEG